METEDGEGGGLHLTRCFLQRGKGKLTLNKIAEGGFLEGLPGGEWKIETNWESKISGWRTKNVLHARRSESQGKKKWQSKGLFGSKKEGGGGVGPAHAREFGANFKKKKVVAWRKKQDQKKEEKREKKWGIISAGKGRGGKGGRMAG